jgi:hypothetical protein
MSALLTSFVVREAVHLHFTVRRLPSTSGPGMLGGEGPIGSRLVLLPLLLAGSDAIFVQYYPGLGSCVVICDLRFAEGL